MPVKDHPYAVRLERLERKMVLEPLGVREAEHTAGIPMTGYDRQTAIAVALPGVIGHPCGSIRRLSRFPPPIADDVPQHTYKAEQNQEYNPRSYHYPIRVKWKFC